MTEETIGRRIAAHRKRMGLTQDALAERLGVTAQAVSKWENDQSCPDILLLPRLAEIFSITTDELLGMERKGEAEILPQPVEQIPTPAAITGTSNRKEGVGVAVWLLLAGMVLLISRLTGVHTPGMWKTLGLTGLMVFGLFGLYPAFSVFRLGCAAAGGYYLYVELFQPAVVLNEELLIPVLLVFFGVSLLVNAFRKEGRLTMEVAITPDKQNSFEYAGNAFSCTTCFGEAHRMISLPTLEGGDASLVFGKLSVDLRDCQEPAENACVALKCCFGTLTLYVPGQWRVQCANKTFFGTVQETGAPGCDTGKLLRVESDAVFGEIHIKYI